MPASFLPNSEHGLKFSEFKMSDLSCLPVCLSVTASVPYSVRVNASGK